MDYCKLEMEEPQELTIDKPLQPELETSRAELFAFYLYAFASEAYVSTANAVCIPIIIETLTSKAGYFVSSPSESCDISVPNYQCQIPILGMNLDTNSFSLYVTSFSVLIQSLLFISFGAVADHSRFKKIFQFLFALLGSLTCIMFILSSNWTVLAVLAIVSNVCFGVSYVFYYAYVPTLTKNYPLPDSLPNQKDGDIEKAVEKEIDLVHQRTVISNQISSYGFLFGYLGGVLTLVLALVFLFFSGNNIFNLQLVVAFVGIWWLCFSLVSMKYTRSRAGPPLPPGSSYLTYGWLQLISSLRKWKKLSQLYIFLAAWFLLSDALGSIIYVAVLFAKSQLNMNQTELIVMALIAPLSAAIGTVVWNFIYKKMGWTTKTMILILLSLYLLLPLYSLFGLTDLGFGLIHKWEVYCLATFHGFLLGSVQSFCRVLFSDILPPNRENEFFALYEITDKGSSWMGPLVIGLIANWSHNIRFGFFFILFTFLTPLIVLWFFDPVKAKRQARNYLN